MRMRNSDLILYSIYLLKDKNPDHFVYSRDDVTSTLNIKYSSLNVYLSELVKEGKIIRNKKHFVKDYISTIDITDRGYSTLKNISQEFNDCVLTPERHGISSCVNIKDILNDIRNPLEKVFLLGLYVRKFSFDLNEYLNNIQTANNDSNIIGYFKQLEKESQDITLKPFNIDIFNLSLYGSKEINDTTLFDKLNSSSINSYLIHAETQRKQGNLEYALMIYEAILSKKHHINQNQWFIANLGIAQVYRRKGLVNDSLNYLDSLSIETKNKMYLAIIKYTQGIYVLRNDDFERAVSLLSSSLKSFINLKNNLFISIAYTSRGVVYFRQNKIELAGLDWINARKFAVKSHSDYALAWVLINLADYEINIDNLKKAYNHLLKAKKTFKEKGDDEGLSFTEFNLALLEISKNNPTKAKNHMKISLSINPNIPCPNDKRVLLEEFVNRGRKFGYDFSDDLNTAY